MTPLEYFKKMYKFTHISAEALSNLIRQIFYNIMSINSTKNSLAKYSTPLCNVMQLESFDSLLTGSPVDTSINDWQTDPDVINL